VEHFHRTDKVTMPCPYEHWVQTDEPEVGTNGIQTGQMTRVWNQVTEAELRAPMPSSQATVAEVLDGNRSEARNKGREREGEDLVLVGKQQVAIGREATHEAYDRKDMSAMDKIDFVVKIQGAMEKGQELVEEGKLIIRNATRRRQATQWNKKK